MRRDSKQQFYGTAQWQQIRRNVLAVQPLCLMCKREGKTTASTVVDHVIGFMDKYDPLAIDTENMIGLCKPHHSIVTQAYDMTGRLIGLSVEEAKSIKYATQLIGDDGYPIEVEEIKEDDTPDEYDLFSV